MIPLPIMARGILLIAVSMMLIGCVDVVVHQEIGRDGFTTGTLELSLNLTSIYSQMGAPPSSYATLDSQMGNAMCQNLTATANLTNPDCTVMDGTLMIRGTLPNGTLNETTGFIRKQMLTQTWYVYTPNISGMGMGANASQFLDLASKQNANMTLIIGMPGKIISVKGGKIVHRLGGLIGEASFNLLTSLSRGKPISVTSVETDGPLLTAILIMFLIGIFILPIVRPIIHLRKEKSLYKDSPGTVVYMASCMILMGVFFGLVNAYTISDPQWLMALFALCCIWGFTIAAIGYVTSDFRLTGKGIEYCSNFVRATIPYSRIKKAERAKLRLGLRGYHVTTTSGASIKPTHTEIRPGRIGMKGVFIAFKDGRSIYYPAKDIGWVIEAINGRI